MWEPEFPPQKTLGCQSVARSPPHRFGWKRTPGGGTVAEHKVEESNVATLALVDYSLLTQLKSTFGISRKRI